VAATEAGKEGQGDERLLIFFPLVFLCFQSPDREVEKEDSTVLVDGCTKHAPLCLMTSDDFCYLPFAFCFGTYFFLFFLDGLPLVVLLFLMSVSSPSHSFTACY
jgi:hypothetical protein